jgi:hypothetical protein
MHSSKQLSTESFALTLDGRPATLDDALPGFHAHDRLGIVVRRPCGALGASTLLLAAVNGFFDAQRARSDDFFIYPDFFLFHVGERHGDFKMVDVWPAHKEVVVADDAELLLQAINDRAITRLLVPDGEPGTAEPARHTRESAESRIVSALAYAPDGRARDADVTVRGNAVTESYVRGVLDQSTMVPATVRAEIRAARDRRAADGGPEEHYRRIALVDALALLGGAAAVSAPRAGSASAAR